VAAIFTSKSYKFLEELRNNNTRIWFNANKDRYIEDVRDRLRRKKTKYRFLIGECRY